MKATIDKAKGTLTIEIQLETTPHASASGKTLVVASTHGNQATGLNVDGKALIVGLNAYVRA